MLTDDVRGSYNKNLHLSEELRALDSELFDFLSSVPEEPTLRDLQRVEREGVIPGAIYFNNFAPRDRESRAAFHAQCMRALLGVELAFFDTDIGTEVISRRKGHKESVKYVYDDELADHYAAGRSLLIYRRYPRQKRPEFISELVRRLWCKLKCDGIWVFASPDVAFIMLVRPEHQQKVIHAVAEVDRLWPNSFLQAVRYES